jgi:hypothetical protein
MAKTRENLSPAGIGPDRKKKKKKINFIDGVTAEVSERVAKAGHKVGKKEADNRRKKAIADVRGMMATGTMGKLATAEREKRSKKIEEEIERMMKKKNKK